MTTENAQATPGEGPQFAILRIYLKDVSFETPNSPNIFTQNFKPEIDFQMNTTVSQLEADVYEVVLTITVTAKEGDMTGFLVEIQQAGIFSISGHEEDHHNRMLGSYCPSTLFPYARAAISDLVSKGAFPPLELAPMNFRALYEQSRKKAQADNETPRKPATPEL